MRKRTPMIIELRGRHNERILRIDTSAYKNCHGIFIEVTPREERQEHFPPKIAFAAWNPNRNVGDLTDQPGHVSATSTRQARIEEPRGPAPSGPTSVVQQEPSSLQISGAPEGVLAAGAAPAA